MTLYLNYYFDVDIGCPKAITFDRGGENNIIAESQIAFRLNDNDGLSGEKSVRFGSSPSNSVS